MSGVVIVTGTPDRICSWNNGMTDPRDARTLPYLTQMNGLWAIKICGNKNPLLKCLGHTHHVDRLAGLVCRDPDNGFDRQVEFPDGPDNIFRTEMFVLTAS